MQWSTRHPTCLNPTIESQTFAPVLEIGIKGIDYPFVNFEFACTNFEGDENDAMGWRFGWRWLLHSQFKLSFDLTPKVHLINFTFCLWFQVIFSSRACQLYGHLKPLLSIQWEVPLLNFQPRLKVQCVTKCSHPPFPSP